MSLGGGASTPIDAAVQNAVNDGITVAVAAGNDNGGRVQRLAGPSAQRADRRRDRQHRQQGELFEHRIVRRPVRPWLGRLSAWYTSDIATNTLSGTSMATPHVAGTAALYLAENPGATPSQVETAIESNASTGKVTGTPGGCTEPARLHEVLHRAGRDRARRPALTASFNGPPQLSWTVPERRPVADHGVQGLPRATTPAGTGSTPLTTLANYVTTYTDSTRSGRHHLLLQGRGSERDRRDAVATRSPVRRRHRCTSSSPQGNWVNAYGSQGYVLGGWNNGTSDLGVAASGATFTLDQGSRYCWTCSTHRRRARCRTRRTPRRRGRRRRPVPRRPSSGRV